jgi:hypothetical protein
MEPMQAGIVDGTLLPLLLYRVAAVFSRFIISQYCLTFLHVEYMHRHHQHTSSEPMIS